MKDAIIYLGKIRLPLSPARIHFSLPTLSARYELVGAGEAEILQGAKLAEIQIEGFLPSEPRYYANDADSPQSYVDAIRDLVEKAEPFQFVYIGKSWDLNMLCSMQTPSFSESGGCFDVDYKLTLRKWVEINTQKTKNPETRPRISSPRSSASAAYTVKDGDTLSHIAKYTLGDSSRWPEIYELNKGTINNPNLIYPGQTLILPPDSSGNVTPKRVHSKKTSSSSSSKKSSSSTSSSSSKKNKASSGANANTISPSSTTASTSVKSSANKRSGPSPAPNYSSAADFYNAFAK